MTTKHFLMFSIFLSFLLAVLKQPGQWLAKINSSFLCSDKASLMTIMDSANVEKKYKNGSPCSLKVLIIAAQVR